jgi:GrpB-like predicted nucleotidyltransferase (UPF0157 family)
VVRAGGVRAVTSDLVVIVEYSPSWPPRFAALAARAAAVLWAMPVAIEHVGSTAVQGLPAKPIIDLDVIVAREDVVRALERLATLGYVHQGDLGLPGRESLRWPSGEERHHLYVCTADTPALRDHIVFRDHLRAHPDVARAYGALKRALVAQGTPDREAYQAGKAEFIDTVTRAANHSTGSA